MNEDALRTDVATACRILGQRGLAHDIIGHVSARCEDDSRQMWMRFRGPDERGLAHTTPDVIRRVALTGSREHESGYDLPLEFPIHGVILDARPDVQSVVHAHPPYSVLCGVAGIPLEPVYGAYESDGMLLAHAGIPVFLRSQHISSWKVGKDLAETLGDKDACLLRGHGTVTVGRSVAEAMLRTIRLERLAWFIWQLRLAGVTDAAEKMNYEDIKFFARPDRVDIPRATDRRWRAYAAEVEL